LALDNKTEAATYYAANVGTGFTRDGAKAAVDSVDGTRASVLDSKAATDSGTQSSGDTFTLTTGVDDFTGTANNDTFTGVIQDTGTTLTALDSVVGGAGNDTLKINALGEPSGGGAVTGLPAVSLSSIETINLRSAVAITADMSGSAYADVTTINSTQAAGAQTLTARATADVNVSGAAGFITLDGGNNVSVSDAIAGNAITIGATTGPVGTITVVDSAQGSGAIAIDGGTDVTVSATSDVATGTIDVGLNTAATGAVAVTQNLNSEGDVLDNSAGDIEVLGGTTVDVTVNGTITADAATDDGHVLTSGDVVVTGDGNTTAVNVTQNLTANDYEKAAIDDVLPTQVLTFKALADTESTTVGGLTFTASKALTAAEVAAAFSGLTADDTQDAGGSSANGTYTGSLTANFTSGAASGAVVTFTGESAGDTAMTVTAGDIDPTSAFTAGTDNTTTAEEADVSVVYGTVTVADGGTDSITDVTLDGYGNSTVDADALANLSLTNGVGTMGVTSTATSLDLTVNNVDGDVTFGAALTSLNLTSETEESAFALTASGVESLTVNAAAGLDLTGSTMSTNLETVSISGAGAVDLTSVAGATGLTSFDASANTGGVTTTVEVDAGTLTGTLTDYVLSAGNDDVTVQATTGSAVDVKVSAGAGDDKVTLGSGINSAGSVISGGAGTDTLVMDAADAVTASATTTFETKIDGFEKLSLNAASAVGTVDLANMDDISYVVSENGSAVAPVAEVQELDFTGVTVDVDGSITVGGVTVAVLGADTDAQIAGKVQTALDGTTLTTPASTGNVTASVTGAVVTVNFPTSAGDVANITVANGGSTLTGPVAVTEDTKGAVNGGGSLTLDNMANDGTVELTESGGGVTVDMLDATGAADSLNVKVSNENTVTAGTVTAADVETINVESDDIFTDTNSDGDDDNVAAHTLTVGGNDATSVVVTGNGNITLTAGSSALTTVDASALTGNLTYTANGATAGTTVTGGAGDDALTADGSGDTLIGGAGNDTLKGDDLTQLTGGEGSDTFLMNMPSNVNTYSTITDLEAGDVIKFDSATAGDVEFSSAALTLASTAVFQDYANAAVNQFGIDVDDAAWFQFGGNTFVVQSGGNHGTTADFQAGQDSIIQITGVVDLSTASYNQTDGTLEIA
jgi:S-layer protein